jgi:hypothetical protein
MPDGGGPMNEVDEGNTMQFRCLVGHSFSPEALPVASAARMSTGSLASELWNAAAVPWKLH